MTDPERRGPQSENPRFETVRSQPNYAGSADGPVRYTRVYVDERPVAYVWVAVDDSAAGVLPIGRTGNNAAAGWYARLRTSYAAGRPPSEMLTRWAGEPLDPTDERSGVVHEGEVREAASLDALKQLAEQ